MDVKTISAKMEKRESVLYHDAEYTPTAIIYRLMPLPNGKRYWGTQIELLDHNEHSVVIVDPDEIKEIEDLKK